MNNIFISYDLIAPGQRYDKIAAAIKSLGSWAHVLESLWYVRSNHTAESALKVVRAALDPNDKLIVVDATNDNASWVNIDPVVGKHLQQQWRQ